MGIEVGFELAIGEVAEQVGTLGRAVDRANRYKPDIARAVAHGQVLPTQAIALLFQQQPATGKIWALRGFNGISDDTVAGFFGTNGSVTYWHLFIGQPVNLTNGQIFTAATYPINQNAGDYVAGTATGEFFGGGMTFSSRSVWCRQGQQLYAISYSGSGATTSAANYTANVLYDEYDLDDVLPSYEGGRGGMRKNHPVHVLPEG